MCNRHGAGHGTCHIDHICMELRLLNVIEYDAQFKIKTPNYYCTFLFIIASVLTNFSMKSVC